MPQKRPDCFWDDAKSITLTKFCVLLLAAASAALTLGGPWLLTWITHTYHRELLQSTAGITTLWGLSYLCAALAFGMLYNLYRFLQRLEHARVFVAQNVTALRRISWCCAGAAAICLPGGLALQLPFALALGVAAGFMALLVRVIKNAFAEAVRMKNELDYTV